MALTRQGLPVLDRSHIEPENRLSRGAYILKDALDGKPDVILIATGSEVSVAMKACRSLEEKNIKVRVVSMPSWELFERQPEDYRESVLPRDVSARVAIEAGATQGWHRYVGTKGAAIGIDHFGASAPYQKLYEAFGITERKLVEKAMEILDRS
jgi:transketolase